MDAASPPSLRARLRRCARLAPRRGVLGLEATVALTAASLAVRLLPEPRVTRLLGRPEPAGEALARERPGPEARLVGRAVDLVAARLPWRPVCLPQAIATRWLLRRRGIVCVAHLGVTATEPFVAHAWITVRGTVVQGGPVGHATELARLR
jgi:hypothetical protein